jgi:hypothetical protein
MRTLVICHDRAALDREGLVLWLSSFSEVVGTLVIREQPARRWRRIRREIKRVGFWRFLDVLAYRGYYRLAHASADAQWEAAALERLRARYPWAVAPPELVVASPNSAEAEAFVRTCQPDLVLARCKTLLKRSVFSIPRLGTFVMHPGICPEYRNAHGCFWALASNDPENVGVTLLRIDEGVDTGPVFGHFRVTPGPLRESHIVLQHRATLENLDAIRNRLLEIEGGTASPIDTSGRKSAAWGQPWLSAALRVRRRHAAGAAGPRPVEAPTARRQ